MHGQVRGRFRGEGSLHRQKHSVTCSVTTLNYFKGFWVTPGNPDICSALPAVARFVLLWLFSRNKNTFFNVLSKGPVFFFSRDLSLSSIYNLKWHEFERYHQVSENTQPQTFFFKSSVKDLIINERGREGGRERERERERERDINVREKHRSIDWLPP